VKHVVMIEDNPASIRMARFNVDYHKMEHIDIEYGKVEEKLPLNFQNAMSDKSVIFVDPPRKGLKPEVLETITKGKSRTIYYLSCQLASLVRDLLLLKGHRFVVKRVVPFDFFPKTKHLETLVLLQSKH